jgi:glycine C-acetyltransferase
MPRFEPIPHAALSAVASDVQTGGGPNMLSRWDAHQAWWETRLRHGLVPDGQWDEARTTRDARSANCLNFTTQDQLNLSGHAAVQAAAKLAIERFGLHGPGPVGRAGHASLTEELEQRVARFLGYTQCTLFPTGWMAGQALVSTLARPGDHVILDEFVTDGLRDGARLSGAQMHRVGHLSNEAVLRRLSSLRAEPAKAGILVITQSLFPMDGETPDLTGLQSLCRQYGATLLVDVSHDLGALGADGRGHLGAQGMLGLADVVTGSFCGSFASQGGFVASHARGLQLGLRHASAPLGFGQPLSPVQAATVLAAFDVIGSFEGKTRRQHLIRNAVVLREGLRAAGFQVLGEPSGIVPVLLGPPAWARLMTRYTLAGGALVNLTEAPVVPRDACGWLLRVTADHSPAQMDRMVGITVQARQQALAHAAELGLRDDAAPGHPDFATGWPLSPPANNP